MKTKQFKFNYEEGAEYVPTPFDEKNLTTDWLEEFFFDNNCAKNRFGRILGFGCLDRCFDDPVLVEWVGNVAKWKFIQSSFLLEEDVENFMERLKDYLKDSEGLAFTVSLVHLVKSKPRPNFYGPDIKVTFYAKVK